MNVSGILWFVLIWCVFQASQLNLLKLGLQQGKSKIFYFVIHHSKSHDRIVYLIRY